MFITFSFIYYRLFVRISYKCEIRGSNFYTFLFIRFSDGVYKSGVEYNKKDLYVIFKWNYKYYKFK